MTSRRSGLLVLFALPLLVFMSAEEGGHVSATMDFLGKLVNFLILFGGLAFVLRKPLKAMLAKRTADIGDSIRDAEGARAAAETKSEGSRARLAGLSEEIGRLKAAAEEEGRRETGRISRAAADAIRSSAETEALKEKSRLVREVQAEGRAEIEKAKEELLREMETLKKELDARTAEIAETIEKRILDR